METDKLVKFLHEYTALMDEFDIPMFDAIGILLIPTLYFNGDKPIDHIEDEDFIEKMRNKLGVIW